MMARHLVMQRLFQLPLQPPVGHHGLRGQQVAKREQVRQGQDLGEAVVQGAAGLAVCHPGEALELIIYQLVEQVRHGLKLRW